MPRLFTAAGNLLLLTASLVVALLLAEGVVRLLSPQRLVNEPRYLYEVSPTLGYKPSRNYEGVWTTVEFSTPIRTNSLGFRDYELPPKGTGTFRILGLGDSFTFGAAAPLEQTYLKILERRLNEGSLGRFQVLNTGVDGYGPQHYLQYLKEAGLSLEPDLVTIGFYVANDVTDRIKYTWYIQNGLLNSYKPTLTFRYSVLHPINEFFKQHSHLFILIRTRFDYALWKIGLRPYYFPEVFAVADTPHTLQSWEFTKNVLRDLVHLAASRGTRTVVVIIPTYYQVHEEYWREYVRVYNIRQDTVDLLKPQRILKQFAEELGVPVLDLLPRFREVGTGTTLYFKIDGHWNSDGQRLAGEELHRFLVSRQLIPTLSNGRVRPSVR